MKPTIELITTKTLIMVETAVCLLYLVQGSLWKTWEKQFLKSIRSNNHPTLGLGSNEGQVNVSYDYC